MTKNELTSIFQEDASAIAELVWGYLDDKYLSGLRVKIAEYKEQVQKAPTNEIMLLDAITPYMREQEFTIMKVIELLTYNAIIDKILEDYTGIQSIYRDSNPEIEKLKKLAFKIVAYKLIVFVENT